MRTDFFLVLSQGDARPSVMVAIDPPNPSVFQLLSAFKIAYQPPDRGLSSIGMMAIRPSTHLTSSNLRTSISFNAMPRALIP